MLISITDSFDGAAGMLIQIVRKIPIESINSTNTDSIYIIIGQAYFPMVFSLYNPDYVTVQKSQSLRNGYHREGGTLNLLSKETGFWRDFGFGMVCTYRYFFTKDFN